MIEYKEQTLISPRESEIRLEAWITNSKYLQTPNRFNEWSFDFQPQTTQDLERFHELANRFLFELDWQAGPYSNKKAAKGYERASGELFATQLFKPKLNIEHPDEWFWEGREVSLCLHLRDLPSGVIVANCDYVDGFEDTETDAAAVVMVDGRPERINDDDW